MFRTNEARQSSTMSINPQWDRLNSIALPDPNSTRQLLKHCLKMEPKIDVIARSHQDKEIDLLTQLGAKEVVQPEFEAALELGAHLLSTFGKSDEHIQAVLEEIRQDRYVSIRFGLIS